MINHVVQTLTTEVVSLNLSDYVIDISNATTSITSLVLVFFRHFGVLGNMLFFICSAWFFIDKKDNKKIKCIDLAMQVWVVSIIILLVSLFVLKGNLSKSYVVKSFLPTTFSNNWYITCYLIFYLIFPFLNIIINNISRVTHLKVGILSFVIYFIIDFVIGNEFFATKLVFWLVIYFIIAYIKKYLVDIANSKKINFAVLLIGVALLAFSIISIDYLGLRVSAFKGWITKGFVDNNPIMLLIAISLFNLFRVINFKNVVINCLSSLTLFIYIIHENIIIRTYYRPLIWDYINVNYGNNHIIGWVIIVSAIVFAVSMLLSILYSLTIRRIVTKAVSFGYNKLEEKLKKIIT